MATLIATVLVSVFLGSILRLFDDAEEEVARGCISIKRKFFFWPLASGLAATKFGKGILAAYQRNDDAVPFNFPQSYINFWGSLQFINS